MHTDGEAYPMALFTCTSFAKAYGWLNYSHFCRWDVELRRRVFNAFRKHFHQVKLILRPWCSNSGHWIQAVDANAVGCLVEHCVLSAFMLVPTSPEDDFMFVVTPQLYLCATCWSSLAFYPYVYYRSASPFNTRLLWPLLRSQCLADTVSFCVGIAHPPHLLPLWVMPGPYAFLLRLHSHTLALPPF